MSKEWAEPKVLRWPKEGPTAGCSKYVKLRFGNKSKERRNPRARFTRRMSVSSSFWQSFSLFSSQLGHWSGLAPCCASCLGHVLVLSLGQLVALAGHLWLEELRLVAFLHLKPEVLPGQGEMR